MIVGIDVGKHSVKYASLYGVGHFPSTLYPHRELNLINDLGKYDFIVEYKGQKYLTGELGERDGVGGLFNSDLSKNHDETLIVLLLVLSILNGNIFKVVMGSPVSMHNEKEKQQIKERFKGSHKIKINGKEQIILIKELEIAAEGAGAFWNSPRSGLVRGLDFGSTTVNYFTLQDKKYIDKASGTFDLGMNTSNIGVTEIAKSVIANLKGKWNKDDYVMVLGGGGNKAIGTIKEYFPNAYLLPNNLTANAEGFYRIGSVIYD